MPPKHARITEKPRSIYTIKTIGKVMVENIELFCKKCRKGWTFPVLEGMKIIALMCDDCGSELCSKEEYDKRTTTFGGSDLW